MTELQKPLYTLTVGEYIALNQRILREVLRERPDAQPTVPQPDILSVIETANLLQVSVPTIYGYSHRKILGKKRMKGCRKIFFSRQEVMNLLDAGRTKTNAELEQEANNHVAFKK